MSLIKSAISGIKWVTFSRFIKQGLQFVTLVILAKLLAVSDFGLMSTAMIYIGFLQVIYDLGVSAALIQKKDISDNLFSSVFWLNILVGLLITIILFFSATLIAEFHGEKQLEEIIKVLSIVFVLSSIKSAQQAVIERNLNFNTISKIEIISSFLGALVGVLLAFLGYGVWSLVFQNIVLTATSSLLIWFRGNKRPNFYFSFREIKSIFKFSINLSGFNLVNYFVRNADYFLISKFIGVEALGLYTLAYKIMLYPLQNITYIISRVMYPVYSKLVDDNNEFKNMFILVAKVISIITFPMMLGLMAVSDLFVQVVLDEKWNDIVPLILLLSPLGLIQSVYTPAGAIFKAKDKTDIWFRWGVFSGIVTVSAFIIGLRWGIIGVAVGYLISNLILIVPGMKIPFKYIDLKVGQFIGSLSTTFYCSVIMFLSIVLVKYFFPESNKIFELILLIIFGIFVYLISNLLFNKRNMVEIINVIRS